MIWRSHPRTKDPPAATVVSDVAMSPEIAGIIGAVGGALTAVLGTIYTARRKEQRDARAASRLLLAELEEARNAIAFALDENDWETLASRPPELPSWARVSQMVAAHVRPKTWRSLAGAQKPSSLWPTSRDLGKARVASTQTPILTHPAIATEPS